MRNTLVWRASAPSYAWRFTPKFYSSPPPPPNQGGDNPPPPPPPPIIPATRF